MDHLDTVPHTAMKHPHYLPHIQTLSQQFEDTTTAEQPQILVDLNNVVTLYEAELADIDKVAEEANKAGYATVQGKQRTGTEAAFSDA